MRTLLAFTLGTLLISPFGCSSTATVLESSDAGPGSDAFVPETDSGITPQADAAGESCTIAANSTLPGVRIEFGKPVKCVYTLAEAQAGISIPYTVWIAGEAAASNLVPTRTDAGQCADPDASHLIVSERLTGGGQSFCNCDHGKCAGAAIPPANLTPGSHLDHTFVWHGKNWNGPSDTGNPEGAAFPVGTYTLAIHSEGTYSGNNYAVDATLQIRLQ